MTTTRSALSLLDLAVGTWARLPDEVVADVVPPQRTAPSSGFGEAEDVPAPVA